jgi:putative ABC transport system ATP-binding protein
VVNQSPPIIVANLHKAYRRGGTVTHVLCDISFTVERGECVFLIGPSGSGKTTLLSILGCVLSPDSGRVEILGRDVERLDPQSAAVLRRDKIGFLFQRFHLIRGLTAIENVALPLILRGMSERTASRRSSELLDLVDLADRRSHHVGQLSVGQCQRVALARALVGEPELILVDEPTAALDATHGQTAMQLLCDLARRVRTTVVVVTHDQRILPFADRVLSLENGKLTVGPDSRMTPTKPMWEANPFADVDAIEACVRQLTSESRRASISDVSSGVAASSS